MAKPGWYAVATMHGYMVSDSWPQVEKFLQSGPGKELHKKFSTVEEAENFGRTQWRILTGQGSQVSTSRAAAETAGCTESAAPHPADIGGQDTRGSEGAELPPW